MACCSPLYAVTTKPKGSLMNSRLWNRGKEDYSEKFKGKVITIPAGKNVLMNTYDAAAFKGQYPGKGVVKMLELEDIPDKSPEKALVICNFCGASFSTTEELNNHIGIHRPAQIEEGNVSHETYKKNPRGRPRKTEVVNDSGANTVNSQVSNK